MAMKNYLCTYTHAVKLPAKAKDISSKSNEHIESHGTGHVSWVLNNDTKAVEDA